MDIDKFYKEAAANYDQHKAFVKSVKKSNSKNLDVQFHTVHNEVFEEIDCLECANCCKTTSPIFYEPDIERVARLLKMKVGKFIDTYLHKDDDGDFVLNENPCPFLGYDNKCIVYESRPTACREYPHTNRKRMRQVLDLTLKNTQVCPAVNEILNRMDTLISQ